MVGTPRERITLSLSGTELIQCSIQDVLRLFMPPLKSDEARTDFYTVYKRESTEYDTNYVKKYDEDLNTTLVFVRLPIL